MHNGYPKWFSLRINVAWQISNWVHTPFCYYCCCSCCWCCHFVRFLGSIRLKNSFTLLNGIGFVETKERCWLYCSHRIIISLFRFHSMKTMFKHIGWLLLPMKYQKKTTRHLKFMFNVSIVGIFHVITLFQIKNWMSWFSSLLY